MKKDIKLTYLKKATKFLDKNKNIITMSQSDALIIKFIKKKIYNIDTNVDYKSFGAKASDSKWKNIIISEF